MANRERAICQEEEKRDRVRKINGRKTAEREREIKKENSERRKRPRVCMREKGWETLERFSHYLG